MTIKLKDIHISGAQTGIKADGPVRIEADNVTFDGVHTPWDLGSEASGSIRGSRVTNDPKLRYTESGVATKLGYRRLKGPPLPIFCPSCKSVSASKNHVFAGMWWELWDSEEPCPICLKDGAKLSEGIFNLSGEVAQIISAPDFTHAMLSQVLEIAAAASKKQITHEEAIEATERVSRPLASVWRKACAIGVPVLIAMYASLSGWGSFYYDATSETDTHLAKLVASESRQEKILEQMLDRLPSPVDKSISTEKQFVNGDRRVNSEHPTAGQPPSETGSVKLKHQRKPKARDIRRKADHERRRALRGERHPATPKPRS